MKYKRSVIEVKIRLDPLEGWGHNPNDHVKILEGALDDLVNHLKPEVKLIRVEDEEEGESNDNRADNPNTHRARPLRGAF